MPIKRKLEQILSTNLCEIRIYPSSAVSCNVSVDKNVFDMKISTGSYTKHVINTTAVFSCKNFGRDVNPNANPNKIFSENNGNFSAISIHSISEEKLLKFL